MIKILIQITWEDCDIKQGQQNTYCSFVLIKEKHT